ncbi:hypothetical protein [Streptomyces canus]|uniref:hypothetical protein n=1 Tax=Streptomyces canus TaxID=58343 RepID=UPI002E2826C4|nr:hypothetical protein [Streptomyces canus]
MADLANLKRANAQERSEEAEAVAAQPSKSSTGASGTAESGSKEGPKQASNFFAPEDKLNKMVPKTKKVPGYHDVWIHGSSNGVSPTPAPWPRSTGSTACRVAGPPNGAARKGSATEP